MNTTFRKWAVAGLLLFATLFITSGGLALDRGLLTTDPIADVIYAPDLSSTAADTVYGGPPMPDHHGDPDDPDKIPPMFLFIFSRLIVLGR